MLNRSYLERLQYKFAPLATNGKPLRVAIVGIGHPLRRDDAAGLVLVNRLRQANLKTSNLLLIEAGPLPENFTGQLCAFCPDLVMIVDAADMGAAPGVVRWLDWHQIAYSGRLTHDAPLQFFGAFLAAELECQVVLLGIQPANIFFGEELSPPVVHSISRLVLTLSELVNFYCYPKADTLPQNRKE